jgi:hypothetical protein
MEQEIQYGEAAERSDLTEIQMPAPTLWPLALAFGLMLIFAGIAFRLPVVSYLGIAIGLLSAVAWWRIVIPNEAHEACPINPLQRPSPIEVGARSVVRLQLGEDRHRVRIPEEIHPYSAGIVGGLAGGAVMAALACLYGLIAHHSIWYPVNLLAGVVIPSIGHETEAQLQAFDGFALASAFVGHVVISMLVGVLYAVALPMFPKYAAWWAGILMPLIWSGVIATLLSLVNPSLNEHISWLWFVFCQLGFGLVGGYVIARSTSIRTMQTWTLAERAFVDAPGISPEERNRLD